MAPKKKSNKKQENLEVEESSPVEPVEPSPVQLLQPSSVEPVEPSSVEHVEPSPVEPVKPSYVEIEKPSPVLLEEPSPVLVEESKKETINLEINPLLSNDLQNLLLQTVDQPKPFSQGHINRRPAKMKMRLGF